jgi:hypothetical protein
MNAPGVSFVLLPQREPRMEGATFAPGGPRAAPETVR